jgi:DNA replication protein DnaC
MTTQNLALVDAARQKQSECSTHGTFTSTATRITRLGTVWWTGCPACDKELEERRRAQDAEDAKVELASRLRVANIPLRFSDKTLGNYEPGSDGQRRILGIAKDYAAKFDEHFAAGRCLILSGKVGTGKTHIACGILREISALPFAEGEAWGSAAWHPVRYATVSGVIRAIRETWNNPEVREADAIRKFTRPHLLVLDEVGRQFGSDAERNQIEELLDLRYQEMRPTLVCTNVEKSQLPQYLGERGVDRLRENGGILAVCDWSSHRGQA